MSFISPLTCDSDTTLIDPPPASGLDLTIWESAAKQILRGDAYSREFVDALSVDQIINEISKRLQLPLSTPESRCEWAWAWTQHGALNETASTIAYNIDKGSCSQFAKIPFQDLVKQALGGDAKSLLKFIAEHVRLSIRISRHLREFPDEVPKYAQVQKVSRSLVRFYTDAIY